MQNRKLGRTADHRKALLRNMATSLIEAEQESERTICCHGSLDHISETK